MFQCEGLKHAKFVGKSGVFNVYAGLDLFKGHVVRLLRGDPAKATFYPNHPLHYASKWLSQGAERLHVIDLDAALETGDNRATITELTRSLRMWLEVGGGIRSFKDAETLIRVNVSRVIISTLYFNDKTESLKILNMLGREKVAIALDYDDDGYVVIRGWRERRGLNLYEALEKVLKDGFKHIIITDITRDGTLEGVNKPMLEKIPTAQRSHIIYGGGVVSVEDITSVFKLGFEGVIVGKALYEGILDLRSVRTALQKARQES